MDILILDSEGMKNNSTLFEQNINEILQELTELIHQLLLLHRTKVNMSQWTHFFAKNSSMKCILDCCTSVAVFIASCLVQQ
jgi:hypothetical protein